MHNVLAIVRRDLKRMLTVPAAWIILFGLIFIPPLYAWFNIAGFWNPYGNTDGIKVTVVNNDRGTNNELIGKMNMGRQIVKQLKGNSQLGWSFASQSEAMRRVDSGESFAAIVIPKNFSDRVAGLVSGKQSRPQLDYYVNEKANALATRMTDTGASTVETQVNETFVSTVSKVVSNAVNGAQSTVNTATDNFTSQTVADLNQVAQSIADVRSHISSLNDELTAVPGKTKTARSNLETARQAGANTSKTLGEASTSITNTQNGLNGFLAQANPTLDQSSSLISQASSNANLTVGSVASGLTSANGTVASALASAKQTAKANATLIDKLEKLNLPSSSSVISDLKQQNKQLNDSIDSLNKLNTDNTAVIGSVSQSANGLNSGAQTTLTAADKARTSLLTGTIPNLNTGLNTLSGAAANASAGVSAQSSLIDQSDIVLDQLDQAASSAVQALKGTDAGLRTMEGQLATLITDINALSGSATLDGSGLLAKATDGNGRLDATKIADLMLSPTVLNTKTVYPVKTYGSGMAPLFTNLTLWVGAFMLVVLLKLEVDDDGIDDPTPGERYWGRWCLFAIIAAAQAVVTVAGELVIGVQSHSVPLFFLTAVIAALVYVSITYALSTSFMHVGKALCVALVIVQIPGSSGLYPIDMVPSFFHAMYPFFPFTYSINALRETIGGFYKLDWLTNMGKLLIFAALFFILGLAVKPHLGNLARLVNRELEATDLVNTEPPLHTPHHYPLSQAVRVLADRQEYRMWIENDAKRFARLYPQLIRGALAAGIIIPAAMAITFSLTNGTKVAALVAWVVWLLLMILFLVIVESIRESISRQVELGGLDDETVRTLLGRQRQYEGKGRRRGRRRRQGRGANSSGGNAGNDGAISTADTTRITPIHNDSTPGDIDGMGGNGSDGGTDSDGTDTATDTTVKGGEQ